MVIGDFIGYSSLGLGSLGNTSARAQKAAQERAAVTLEARLDPKSPNEYSVQLPPKAISPPEKPSDVKPAVKRLNQNSDPVSKAFLSIADYAPVIHKIDVKV